MKTFFAYFAFFAALYGQTAVFPNAASTDANLKVAVNGVQTQLLVDMTSTQTTITVTACNGITANVLITIDQEIISVASCAGTTILVDSGGRGYDGTTASTHVAGTIIGAYVDAWHHNVLKNEIEAIESNLIQSPIYSLGTLQYSATTPSASPVTVGTSPLTVYSGPSSGYTAIPNCTGYNGSVGTMTSVASQITVGSSTYTMGTPTASLTSGSAVALSFGTSLTLAYGDTYKVSWSGGGSLTVTCKFIQVANTGGAKTVRLLGVSSGNNTLFTCCDSGYTRAVTAVMTTGVSGAPTMTCYNADASTRNFYTYITPSGGSLTQISPTVALTTATSGTVGTPNSSFYLRAGDVFGINADTGNSLDSCAINLLELP